MTGASALLSLAIEITQPLLGIGANDLMDIVANTLGAFIGAGAATGILLVRDTIANRHLDGPRLAKLLLTLIITAGALLGVSVGGATAIQASGAEQLSRMFASTTLADYTRERNSWGPKIEAFWKSNRIPTNDAYSAENFALQRFTWTFYWSTRCVTARWEPNGFTTVLGQGSQCTERLR